MAAKSTGETKSNVELASTHRKQVAVIDIGATSIRMAIAEVDESGKVRTLETLSQAVSLGKDSFIKGRLDRNTIEDCVNVLRTYRLKLEEYQIRSPQSIRIVATSAVREATNRLAFIDRVYIATGFEIEPFDESELHRVTYMAIQPYLNSPELQNQSVVVVEIGGGSTEILYIRDKSIKFSQTFRLGSLRLRRTLEALHAPEVKMRDIMESEIDKTARQIQDQLYELMGPDENVKVVVMGGDVRFAANNLSGGSKSAELQKMSMRKLSNFADAMASSSIDTLVRKYHMSITDAETLAPGLLAYVHIASALSAQEVIVAPCNLRDGLLREMSLQQSTTTDFRNQIVNSALDLGRKFHFNEEHASHVAQLSQLLFTQLKGEHQLDSRYELTLYLAALLHEIGLYVSNRSFHKHSMYLIQHSELFGLSKRELLLVALLARYHRRASPQPVHEGYGELNREDRVVVSKLAAILRVAKSLDEARNSRIHNFVCDVRPNKIMIEVAGVDDLALEKVALQQNGQLFEEVFGKQITLRAKRSK